MNVTPEPLTLRDCSKAELVTIIERMTAGLGPAAAAFLDLELARADLLRMKAALREATR